MGLFSFIHGKTGRLVIHRLYGWGASLVILGALFKLQHWNFAGIMLTIGMTTECIIFFLSAFEPMPKDFDWSIVYPELSGEDLDEEDNVPARRSGGGFGGLNLEVTPETNEELKLGIQKLAGSLNQMTSLSGIVDASNALIGNMQNASGVMTAVASSAGIVSDNYNRTAQTLNSINEQSKLELEQLRASYNNYRGQLGNIEKTLGSVNSSFELYLEESKKAQQIYINNTKQAGDLHVDEVKQVQAEYDKLRAEINSLIASVQTSANHTQNFGAQMDGLNNNIGQLNSIYGSMLTAVNSVINK
jgi:gliding motility-associated protein GldL